MLPNSGGTASLLTALFPTSIGNIGKVAGGLNVFDRLEVLPTDSNDRPRRYRDP